MEELVTFIVMAGIFVIATALGVNKEKNQTRSQSRPRRPEILAGPVNIPKPRVSTGDGEVKSGTYRANRMNSGGKPVVHPLDYQKNYQNMDNRDQDYPTNQTLKAVRPQNARPVVSPETVPEIYFETATSTAKTPERTASRRPDAEKTPVESAVQREVDEAEEFWKNPVPATSKKARPGQVAARDREQMRKDLLPTTPQDLLQGIVMAEILEPPRAKRPYRPVYMERKK